MELIKQFVKQYWLNVLAVAVFAVDAVRYVQLGKWEEYIVATGTAFFGMVAVVASEDMADWGGQYGWSRQTWRVRPAWWYKLVGIICLIVATALLFAGSG